MVACQDSFGARGDYNVHVPFYFPSLIYLINDAEIAQTHLKSSSY